mgnify:CR=1 FL=1
MKKEIPSNTTHEIKEKNVSNPVRKLVVFFFIFIAFFLVWSMHISLLVAPVFLLIMVVLSLVYYKKDQLGYLVVLSLLVVGYFLTAQMTFPYCELYSPGAIIGVDRYTSCPCSGIKKKVKLDGNNFKKECIGIREKCYKHPYDDSIADRRKVEIPCSSVERESQKVIEEELIERFRKY